MKGKYKLKKKNLKKQASGMGINQYSLKTIYDAFRMQDAITRMAEKDHNIIELKQKIDRFVSKNLFGNCKLLQGINCRKNTKRCLLLCYALTSKTLNAFQN